MVDIIITGFLILGIIIVMKGSKQKKKTFTNVGLMLIALSLIYIVPAFLSGFCKGVLEVATVQ